MATKTKNNAVSLLRSVKICGKLEQQPFTFIELLVITAQHCRHFFKRFVCTDKYGDGLFKIKPIFEFF